MPPLPAPRTVLPWIESPRASTEKIARNNAAFRDANERIQTAAADYGFWDGRTVPFLCECSDESCMTIVRMSLEEYRQVRSNPRWFAHAPGHEERISGVVETVEAREHYVLVEKVGHAGDVATDLACDGTSE